MNGTQFIRGSLLVGVLATCGCIGTSTGGGGGSGGEGPDDSGPMGDTGADAEVVDLGRVDVGEDCVPSDEVCNGADDDCDGVIDNGFAGLGAACTAGEGACAAQGTQVCTADGQGLECDATPGAPSEELCNGADDDCDGAVDNGFPVGEACTVGDEACGTAEGTYVCAADGTVECDARAPGAMDETCNGVDDDCDDAIDEDTGGAACQTGQLGQCAAGVMVCADGAEACEPVTGPEDEVCDGIDNDCDGEVDDVEGLGAACTAGIGGCAVPGAMVCGDDGLECDAVPGMPTPEVCDEVDNDCNGVVDDAPGVGRACAAGVGACSVAGRAVCTAEGVVCDAVPGQPRAETCNGADDDCNGQVDDVAGLGDDCSVGVGACASAGVMACGPNGLACDAPVIEPGVEVCDGRDSDCNGVVDDAPGVGGRCSLGIGECLASGVMVCGDGEVVCNAQPRAPEPEICDGLDNDCNGVEDDPPACVEICDNRIDDDGNGAIDCDDRACAGDPSCGGPLRREMVLLCGNSARDVSVLVRPGDGLAFAAGCQPDATTQAMLVSRNGIDQIDPRSWTAYLEEGGRIITEYSSSDEVFNAVFGAAVAPGRQAGACSDNVNPAFRLNEGDPFWQANAAVPLEPANDSGCGLDLSAYPGITPLGGHTVGAVHLAYRDLGQGRLWLAEGDWQDRDQVAPTHFSAATQTIMRSMILDTFGLQRIGQFRVGDGPNYADAGQVPYSCVQACALIFGGDAGEYGCSTQEAVYDGQAYADGWDDQQYCGGASVAEDFLMPDDGSPYDCGARGCAYSAYVRDHGCNAINHCWRRGAAPLVEICGDGLDNDGDGATDCDDAACADEPECAPAANPDGLVPGIQQNVSDATLAGRGWQRCFQGLYGTDGESIDALRAGCGGDQMLIGCRPVGAGALTLAAEGLTVEVTRNVGNAAQASNPHNGVAFYFDPTHSWGFAPLGQPLARTSCDTAGGLPELRMCWHAGPGNILENGYRCGNNFLNGANGWHREVYTRSVVSLGREAAYGHHGSCETFNDCNDAATCAALACSAEGHGPAISWSEGLCTTLSEGLVPGIVCSLFFDPAGGNLDRGWGPSGGCNIPVVYDVACAAR